VTTINVKDLDLYNQTYPSDEINFSHLQYKNKEHILIREWGNCRTYLSQAIMGKKLGLKLVQDSYILPKDWSYKTGPTFLSIKFPNPQNMNCRANLKKNLGWLNAWEEQAKVSKSVILDTQDPMIVVVQGDKVWKNSTWKHSLWTYLVKCACYSTPRRCDYSFWTEALDKLSNGQKNIDILLSKVKLHYSKEIFDKRIYGESLTSNTHEMHGFFSICTGWNPPMAKLLGIEHEPQQYYIDRKITW